MHCSRSLTFWKQYIELNHMSIMLPWIWITLTILAPYLHSSTYILTNLSLKITCNSHSKGKPWCFTMHEGVLIDVFWLAIGSIWLHYVKCLPISNQCAHSFDVSVTSPRRLIYIYLANDVIQNSKKKGPEFAKDFGSVLGEALSTGYKYASHCPIYTHFFLLVSCSCTCSNFFRTLK